MIILHRKNSTKDTFSWLEGETVQMIKGQVKFIFITKI